ncbi:hypothetical protein [cf. Phormidesmis sp. LEGE 11477]|uniref:hypothetical protein n=1 Tax=cf. Phormidesmis sp. LEGE 11477 TaxID=1828680 RepID=UPI00187F0D05|nr:hypothetical protein [cf. Phormidesmis sp. LEGE 11477]MBE9062486.1 hypothetical protein [cf. Phormidesmis sp. LEGE 11477]
MTVRNAVQRVNTAVDAWFTQPEKNAAGRIGLSRIAYSLFYLWHLSTHSSDFLSGMPGFFVEKEVYLVKYVFRDFGASLPPLFFHTLESLLVAALVLLAFGYKTRAATIAVLLIGCLTEGLSTAIDGKRTLVTLVFYIPFFMALTNAWGKTYSVDSALDKRSGRVTVDPHDSDWDYFLPARALLIIFSALFFGSMVYKVAFGGAWLSYPDMMANFFLNRNIEAALYDLPLNPLAPFIAQTPLLYLCVHATTLLFETFFFLSLINSKIRDFLVSMALLFHAVNGLWLVVTVTPILAGYFLFIDWQAIKDFFFPSSPSSSNTPAIAPKAIALLALFLAAILGLLWHSGLGVRELFNLYGLIDWRTIWYPVLPLSLGWLIMTVVRWRKPVRI